jgi:hypothetical protein
MCVIPYVMYVLVYCLASGVENMMGLVLVGLDDLDDLFWRGPYLALYSPGDRVTSRFGGVLVGYS